MGYHGVVFDLDGTLLDTLEDLAGSTNAALRELGFAEHPVDRYRTFVGDGVGELARRALPEGRRDSASVDRAVAAIRDVYGRRWAERTRPYAEIPELLDELTARRLQLAVLSNKPHDLTTRIVAALLPRWSFAAVLGARPETPRKPDPRGALAIARQLGLPPAQLLYLGDSGVDMTTARAAGMVALGALWGFRGEEELSAAGAQRLLQRPLELLALLDSS
jgi:phosphoglycolate phosphatase